MIDILLKLLGGAVGQSVGRGISNTVSLAALTPAAIWLTGHRNETFDCLTYGDLAVFGIVLLVVVKIAHYTPPPEPNRPLE